MNSYKDRESVVHLSNLCLLFQFNKLDTTTPWASSSSSPPSLFEVSPPLSPLPQWRTSQAEKNQLSQPLASKLTLQFLTTPSSINLLPNLHPSTNNVPPSDRVSCASMTSLPSSLLPPLQILPANQQTRSLSYGTALRSGFLSATYSTSYHHLSLP